MMSLPYFTVFPTLKKKSNRKLAIDLQTMENVSKYKITSNDLKTS